MGQVVDERYAAYDRARHEGVDSSPPGRRMVGTGACGRSDLDRDLADVGAALWTSIRVAGCGSGDRHRLPHRDWRAVQRTPPRRGSTTRRARLRFADAGQPPPGQDGIPALVAEVLEEDHGNGAEPAAVEDERDRQIAELRAELAVSEGTSRLLYLFTQMFSIQLDFLIHLRAAEPDGLSPAAAEEWFANEIVRRPQFIAGAWEPRSLLAWLTGNDFARLTPEGNYVLAVQGHRVLHLIDQNFWYASKIY